MHSFNSRLYWLVFEKCFAEIVEFVPQTFLGITLSNHVRHQLSSCYLEEMDFRAPNCKSTKLAMEGIIDYCFITDYDATRWPVLG